MFVICLGPFLAWTRRYRDTPRTTLGVYSKAARVFTHDMLCEIIVV
jgi:hypothetical protein